MTANGVRSGEAAERPGQGGGQPLFAPPKGAVWLYPGDVMHARMKPRTHRFAYKVFCLLIDIDRLAEASRNARLFSVGRFNLLSFRESDHGAELQDAPAGQLRRHVDRLLAPTSVDARGGRVLLLCYPRLLGFVFNPISVYYVYDVHEDLVALIYEVRNTFGEMHTYVCPVEPGQTSEAGIRQERDKLFYVSPFMAQTMRYHFRMLPPGDRVNVRILETDEGGPILAATFTGARRDLTSAAIVKACVAMPFMTVKVVAGIHWEAMKLWFKGIEFYNRPKRPEPVSYRDPQHR
ncbi:MAG: DUF1365 domain-containing protein [Hyphomicrobiales bacterium]|nr:DUF1365 domain-containing protein [Hyphomicrobiales bacterium]